MHAAYGNCHSDRVGVVDMGAGTESTTTVVGDRPCDALVDGSEEVSSNSESTCSRPLDRSRSSGCLLPDKANGADLRDRDVSCSRLGARTREQRNVRTPFFGSGEFGVDMLRWTEEARRWISAVRLPATAEELTAQLMALSGPRLRTGRTPKVGVAGSDQVRPAVLRDPLGHLLVSNADGLGEELRRRSGSACRSDTHRSAHDARCEARIPCVATPRRPPRWSASTSAPSTSAARGHRSGELGGAGSARHHARGAGQGPRSHLADPSHLAGRRRLDVLGREAAAPTPQHGALRVRRLEEFT